MSLLFSPIRLGGLELPNRIVVSPMCQYRAREGVARPWHVVHIGALALSGAAAVILESTGVEAIGRITAHCLGLYDAAQEAALADLVCQVREVAPACRLGIQLSHAGRKASRDRRWNRRPQVPVAEGGWATVGPSPLAFAPGWLVPHELDQAGLARVRDAFVQAARRADRAGFDILEIHSAHAYLLSQFLSPLSNQRRDAYGGSAAARLRFPLEVLGAVRAAWPAHKALGVRFNATDLDDRGIGIDDALAYARGLAELGVDYLTPSSGSALPGLANPPQVPGYHLEHAARVKAATGVPTMGVGMILDGPQAERVLADGQADVIALGRAVLDNPRWPWHAANALGGPDVYPRPYATARPEVWPGYAPLHPEYRKPSS